jgi:hypothetical protein
MPFSWSDLFSTPAAAKPSKVNTRDELSSKIKELSDKMSHEMAAKNVKVHRLKEFVDGKGRSVLKTTQCSRYLSGIKRHSNMIRVYETSVSALEETLANIEAQRVHTETTAIIGMVSRSMHGLNVDSADDTFARLDDFRQEREELATMMASSVNAGNDDYSELVTELGLTFEGDADEPESRTTVGSVAATVDVSQFASVPTTLATKADSTRNDKDTQRPPGGVPMTVAGGESLF